MLKTLVRALVALPLAACAVVDVPADFPEMPVPADNPLTQAKVDLGRALFFDTRLSRTEEVACASCHRQDAAFADPRPVSAGVEGRTGDRNAPPLFNLAWNTAFMWDGGVPTLEQQAIGPITNPLEMDMTMNEVVTRLSDDPAMIRRFRHAFGEDPTADGVTKALASYERTLVSGESRYDAAERGEETLTPEEEEGRDIFFGERGECFHCHTGFNLTNNGILNNGMDTGDEGYARVTEDEADAGKFKVPSLRNVALTAPYMHDGSVDSLEAVVEHYAAGGQGHPNTDPTIHPLDLDDAEKRALVAFLRTFTDLDFVTDPTLAP
ncbi:MAG: cytochrome-c peroxidase [Myxococcota bacterium]